MPKPSGNKPPPSYRVVDGGACSFYMHPDDRANGASRLERFRPKRVRPNGNGHGNHGEGNNGE